MPARSAIAPVLMGSFSAIGDSKLFFNDKADVEMNYECSTCGGMGCSNCGGGYSCGCGMPGCPVCGGAYSTPDAFGMFNSGS